MNRLKVGISILSIAILTTGCQQTVPAVKEPVKVEKVKPKKKYVERAKKPKKNIELKEVEDTNFSSEYMYPETKKKKAKPVAVAKAETSDTNTASPSTGNMSKGECISMIGQDKFDKYTQMLGDEASAIKRCKMLKAM